MTNPWLKKNPFLSMWLSAFNTAASAARGHAIAQINRQAAAATTHASKALTEAWLGVPSKAKAKAKARKRKTKR